MLSPAAREVIHNYLVLPFGKEKVVPCPYYNNRRSNLRGGLRVLIGKGSPEDIVEEALIISLRDKIDLDALDSETLKKFLIDHKLGVDCSGFAYHVLEAELSAQKKQHLKNVLIFPHSNGLLRRLIIKLRPAENTGVKVLASNENSISVSLSDTVPGDFITMLGTNPSHDYDHVVVIYDISKKEGAPTELKYVHALAWGTDGRYGHNVRQGTIIITNPSGPLTDQTWQEKNMTGSENETYRRALEAQTLELRRLKALAK